MSGKFKFSAQDSDLERTSHIVSVIQKDSKNMINICITY